MTLLDSLKGEAYNKGIMLRNEIPIQESFFELDEENDIVFFQTGFNPNDIQIIYKAANNQFAIKNNAANSISVAYNGHYGTFNTIVGFFAPNNGSQITLIPQGFTYFPLNGDSVAIKAAGNMIQWNNISLVYVNEAETIQREYGLQMDLNCMYKIGIERLQNTGRLGGNWEDIEL